MKRVTAWLLRSRLRTVAAGVLLVSLPLLTLAGATSLYLGRELERRLIREDTSLVSLAAHTLEERIASIVETAELFNKGPFLQEAIRGGDTAGVRVRLRHLVESGRQVERAFIADPRGVLRADFPEDPAVMGVDFSSRDWYRGVSRGWQPYVSEFYQRQAAPQRFLFAVAVPIRDNGSGKVLAVLVIQPAQGFIATAMGNVAVPDGQAYVVDRKGVLIYHTSLATEQKVDFAQTPAVKELFQGREGVLRTIGRYRPVPIVATYHPVRNAGWGVVIDRYESDVLRPARRLTAWIGGYTLLMLAVAGFLAARGAGLLATTDALANRLRDEEEDRRRYAEFLLLLNAPYESVEELCRAALVRVGAACGLSASVCHLVEGETIRPRAAYAAELPAETGPFARECAREGRTRRVHGIPPESHLRLETAVGTLVPREIAAVPLLHQGGVVGVIEAASLTELSDGRLELLERLAAQLAVGVTLLRGHLAQKDLAVELQRSNQELQAVNEEQQAMNEEFRQMNAELESQQKELREANLRIEDASRAKSDFLANMSHELRTPLNSIIGFAEILDQGLQGELTGEQAESVRDISASGRHLLSLINDILDLSKIEAGRMELELGPVDVAALVQEALVLFREKALKHRLSLAAELSPDAGSIVADGRKVKQVLINLLGNAVKFTPEGGSVRVRVRRIPAAGGGIEFAVEDTGIGISPEGQRELFQPFRQVDLALTTREQGGTGLGLSLCRSFVELHGGTIRVESAPGTGSVFTFTLPLTQPAAPGPAPRAPGDESPLRLGAVVVIEDDPTALRTIEAALAGFAGRIHTAGDGESGLALVRAVHPGLVVLDLGLPGMSGFEVARVLRSEPANDGLTIVVLTAMDLGAEDRGRLAAFVDRVLEKGNLTAAQFLQAVREAVGGRA